MSLVDGDRLYHGTNTDVVPASVPLELSFCKFTVESGEPVIIPDTGKDPRFDGNPLVDVSFINFYAGYPLRSPGDPREHVRGRILRVVVRDGLDELVRQTELSRELRARDPRVVRLVSQRRRHECGAGDGELTKHDLAARSIGGADLGDVTEVGDELRDLLRAAVERQPLRGPGLRGARLRVLDDDGARLANVSEDEPSLASLRSAIGHDGQIRAVHDREQTVIRAGPGRGVVSKGIVERDRG